MPTGYTAKLHDGPQEFNDFVLSCSRALGATVHQRDESPELKPKLREPHTSYLEERLNKAATRLREAESWSEEEAQSQAEEQNIKNREYWLGVKERAIARRERYEDMLTQVRAWTPPTDGHVGLKEYMIDQLEESIRFDCHDRGEPIPLTGEEYRAQQIASTERELEYYPKEIEAEIERSNEANKWILDLFASLGIE